MREALYTITDNSLAKTYTQTYGPSAHTHTHTQLKEDEGFLGAKKICDRRLLLIRHRFYMCRCAEEE